MQEFTYISVNNVNSSGMIEIISTDDGSSSLFNSDLNETYHSRHGAVRESTHVFIKKGLSTLSDLEQVSVLEVGMGTGLNVLLTGLYALKTKQKIDLTSLEPYPLEQSLLNKVNYEDSVEDEFSKSVFRKIHACEWEVKSPINLYFTLLKRKIKLELFQEANKFDLIYFDAFGPHAQPELWVESVFSHLSNFCKKGTVLVTYCAQGQFKRNLKSCGFSIERLPGPPGKREMTRGTFVE